MDQNVHFVSGEPLEESKESDATLRQSQPTDGELLDAYSRAVVKVVETVGPAVVSIHAGIRSRGYGPMREGTGSGVLFTPDGYILTNSHVVHEAKHLDVTLTDGRTLKAEKVGEDPATDLAVIQVHETGRLPYAPLGNSAALRAGQLVIAIGNPLGFQSTVSTGVVSSVGRFFRTEEGRLIENIIQHTAPLNPGNSGGPLVDWQGRVVGINTAIILGAQGIGFAIPADTVKWVVSQLLIHGRVRRSYLGIAGRSRPIDRWLVELHELSNRDAVEVMVVEPGAPAGWGGLSEGDLIVAINDQAVTSIDDLHRFLANWPIAKPAAVTVLRGIERLTLRIVPTEAP